MNQPNPAPVVPPWLSRTVVILLAVQVGLLWTHGSMLQRQHDDLQALREDVQSLADSLDQDAQGEDGDGVDQDTSLVGQVPVRLIHGRRLVRSRRHGRPVLVRVQDPATPDSEDPAAKELADSRKSGQEAVAKARKTQEQLSITENYRKAEAKAQAEGNNRWLPWLGFGGAAGVLALVVRGWLRRRS